MPPRTSQRVQVGKRIVELSNLNKVLFPEHQITKAQLILHYSKLAPTILAHLKGRPLSLVRYPDGIDGESFFQKNRPDWAPAWLAHVTLGEEKKDYILATEEASLVWLANLACIELHQMHSRAPYFEKPDYIVYDLDPPEKFRFSDLVGLAFELKEHLERMGYHPFVKTTGRKGLHLLTPIEQKWDFRQAFAAAKAVAEPFVSSHESAMTLHIKKDLRKGKVLLDIYRNRPSQTIVAAYSVRGLAGAPVSTPLHWEELESLTSPKMFDLARVSERVLDSGDPWEAMAAYATPIHTERKATKKRALKPARTYKTPEQLEKYSRKRRFDKTPEPVPAKGSKLPPRQAPAGSNPGPSRLRSSSRALGEGTAFVVHRHHASRLHYDLRLEENGVLKSWAVPKGLPPRPGIMRLAVKVEDHPLEYVHFEGAIPKGQYGGGMMWQFAQGRYEITKKKKEGFYFSLHSPELNGEYRIHRTKENQWLLERVGHPQRDWLRDPVEPMLPRPTKALPRAAADYFYELKWDGLRALITLDEGEIRIRSRNGLNMAQQFPELLAPEAFRAASGLFDGEIVCLDPDGKPNFGKVIQRMQQTTAAGIERGRARYPAVCYVFDCLYLDGRPITDEPLTRRAEWLKDAIKKDGAYRVSETVEHGAPFLKAVKEMGLEGIMAKRRDSRYLPGRRSDAWLKIKTRQTMDCVIIGYTPGKGDRRASFGALHLAQGQGKELSYIGKVGSGFDQDSLKAVAAQLQRLATVRMPLREKPLDVAGSVWVEPKLICEVEYARLTSDGQLREGVFLRLRPDLE